MVSFSLLCSLAVALTLVPMLCARVLSSVRPAGRPARRSGGWLYESSGRWLLGLENGYKRLLHVALDHRLLCDGQRAAPLGGQPAADPLVGTELMPATDEGEVRVEAEMEVGTRLEVLDRQFRRVEEIVNARRCPRSVTSSRPWAARGLARARTPATCASRWCRRPSGRAPARRSPTTCGAELAGIPGTIIRTRAGQGLFVLRMGASSANQIEVEVRGYDFPTADALARRVQEIVGPGRGRHRHPAQPRAGRARGADRHRPAEGGRHEADRVQDRQRPADDPLRDPRPATTARAGTSSASWSSCEDAEKSDLRTSST